ncbi:nucleotidyl transferase AbiEii/AbiGii toxin family protein [Herbaspirillum huttiense]|uniref:nucleotidyl transferase AbiEii/AbiGii toxin family protein n=2 Tax=Herbaspirillum huttiense TaxID=863372 RepID=UPI0038779023
MVMASCMFERPHHRRIAQLLSSLDADFLLACGCYFGGGTAIVLMLGEYRESVDVDFLCSSQDGYRALRNTITNASLGAMLRAPVELAREVRADRYGIRTFVKVDGVAVKFEVVSEGRIAVAGGVDARLGVPVLSRVDMYAEKLLANADRWGDKSALSRDVIDLALMILHWGSIPAAAWDKARLAYGQSIDIAYDKALGLIADPAYLAACLQKMHMDPALAVRIPDLLHSARSGKTAV